MFYFKKLFYLPVKILFYLKVKKPNGDSYAADSILYLVLGIQVRIKQSNRPPPTKQKKWHAKI